MPTSSGVVAEIRIVEGDRPGALARFPFDRTIVERFRQAFPRARWSDELRAWFVPGVTAQRRLDRWFGREFSDALAYADQRGRDAYAFDPVVSPYLTLADDFRVRTPYSSTVRAELRDVPWAWWDSDARVWRVPFRSWDELRRRWPAIEAAARRNEPEARRRRRELERGSPERAAVRARDQERRRRRYPVPLDALPPLDHVLMTGLGAVVFTDVTGEIVDDDIARRHYPHVSSKVGPLVWSVWRVPTHDELVAAWPARTPPADLDRARGWWTPTRNELRAERRKARSLERAKITRRRLPDAVP